MAFSKIARMVRFAVVVSLFAAPVRAQERRVVVVGTIGGASLGHADSEQGNAPIFGGAVGFHLTARLVVEGDVHTARVSHVFGREHHDFTETTFTGSLLFRSTPDGHAHFIAGGGRRSAAAAYRCRRSAVSNRQHRKRSGSFTGGSVQSGISRVEWRSGPRV